jgi:hypothetical protein
MLANTEGFYAGRSIALYPLTLAGQSAEDSACGYLLSLGTRVEILEPQDLRERILQLAQSVLAFYGERYAAGSSIMSSRVGNLIITEASVP